MITLGDNANFGYEYGLEEDADGIQIVRHPFPAYAQRYHKTTYRGWTGASNKSVVKSKPQNFVLKGHSWNPYHNPHTDAWRPLERAQVLKTPADLVCDVNSAPVPERPASSPPRRISYSHSTPSFQLEGMKRYQSMTKRASDVQYAGEAKRYPVKSTDSLAEVFEIVHGRRKAYENWRPPHLRRPKSTHCEPPVPQQVLQPEPITQEQVQQMAFSNLNLDLPGYLVNMTQERPPRTAPANSKRNGEMSPKTDPSWGVTSPYLNKDGSMRASAPSPKSKTTGMRSWSRGSVRGIGSRGHAKEWNRPTRTGGGTRPNTTKARPHTTMGATRSNANPYNRRKVSKGINSKEGSIEPDFGPVSAILDPQQAPKPSAETQKTSETLADTIKKTEQNSENPEASSTQPQPESSTQKPQPEPTPQS